LKEIKHEGDNDGFALSFVFKKPFGFVAMRILYYEHG
jgi:hypothetical protein